MDANESELHYIRIAGVLESVEEVEQAYRGEVKHSDHYLHFKLKHLNNSFNLGTVVKHVDLNEFHKHTNFVDSVTVLISNQDSVYLNNGNELYAYALEAPDGKRIENHYRIKSDLHVKYTMYPSLILGFVLGIGGVFHFFRSRP